MAGLAIARARDPAAALLPEHRYPDTLSEYAEEENNPRKRRSPITRCSASKMRKAM